MSGFGKWLAERPHMPQEDVDDMSMCMCGVPMDRHPEPTEQEPREDAASGI